MVVDLAPNKMSRLNPVAVEGQAIRTLQLYPMLAKPTTVTLTTPGFTLSTHGSRTETADCNNVLAVTA